MSYVVPCVITIVLCMILSVTIELIDAIYLVKQTKRNSRVVLDSYVIESAIDIYDSIKRGNNDQVSLDPEAYISSLSGFCTFEKNGRYLYHKDAKGVEDYWISIPQLTCTTETRLTLRIVYIIYIPLYFCGTQVSTAEVPVTVDSKYIEKFGEE